MARERGLVRELEVSVDTMGRMRKRGIRVLPGGDYGFAWNPHGTYARDLLLVVDGDPLADIKRLQNRDALLVIMKDGRLHKAPSAA